MSTDTWYATLDRLTGNELQELANVLAGSMLNVHRLAVEGRIGRNDATVVFCEVDDLANDVYGFAMAREYGRMALAA